MRRTICSSMSSTKASSSADDWGGFSPLEASSPIVLVVDVAAIVRLLLCDDDSEKFSQSQSCLWVLIF
jgi:hypothetical protein